MPTRFQQEVVMEYEPVGKYKVRLVREGSRAGGEPRMILDIREFISSEQYTGFTKKGVRLSTSDELTTLASILDSLMKADPFSGQDGNVHRNGHKPSPAPSGPAESAAPPTRSLSRSRA